MILRLSRKLFTVDVMGSILAFIALQVFVYGVSSSLRNPDATYFFYASSGAALIGLGLSKTRLNGTRASVVIAVLGIAGIWIIGAHLALPLFNLGKAVFHILAQIVPALRMQVAVDKTPLTEAWLPIVQASSTVWIRMKTWGFGIIRNEPINDVLIRNLVWLLILWILSAWAGWFTSRRNAILAFMPGLLLLAVITSYSERKIETVWFMVLAMLLLMGMWSYKSHTLQWERQKIDYSESIQFDMHQAIFFLAGLIAVLAFITPSLSWRDIREYLRNHNHVSKNETANILGVRQASGSNQNTTVQTPSLPREHLLSGGFAESQKIVMFIKTGELPPMPVFESSTVPRHYWRSAVYDQYVGTGWETSSFTNQNIPATTPLIPALLNGYKLIHLDVNMVEPEGKLFWSGILYSADIPIAASWRVKPQSNPFADQPALLQADIFSAFTNASSFKVDSYVSSVSVQQLRLASTDYPIEITKRYLVLPKSVPARVRDLAIEITQEIANPYDKARAIGRYLRDNYPYDLDIPAPPQGQDVADYFLFDLKKGYCDYYATAMVVLARASGLPARFVSGYSSGTYDTAKAEYIIRELNAHSWVEIYFPEIGWVEFEPTASEPEIQRPEMDNLAQVDQTSRSSARSWLIRFHLENSIYWFAPMLGISILLFVYFLFIEKWLYLRLDPSLAIERIYRRLCRAGRPLAGERTRAETAYEFMNKLIATTDNLAHHFGFLKLISQVQQETINLTNLYCVMLFSSHHVQKKEARLAWHIWTRLRWQLFLARMLLFNINIVSRLKHIQLSINRIFL